MKFLRYNIFWILWLLFITYASNKEPSGLPRVYFLEFEQADKLVHFIFYFILAFTMAYGFNKQMTYVSLKQNLYTLVFILSFVWGGLMELSQKYIFTYRSAEWYDILANSAGAFFGLLCVFIYLNVLTFKK